MKRKSEECSSLTHENNNNKKVKKIKTFVDVNKFVDTSNKILKKCKKAFILSEDADSKVCEKNNKHKTLVSKPNVISEIKLHNKKKEKELKLTIENEDNQKNEHKSHKKVKKTISFQDSVEVCSADSDKKIKRKLKEDLTDTTPITNIISEINSFQKGNKKRKSKKEKKIEKHNEDSKLVQQQCIEYLRKWKNDKNNWKFEKAKQIRLLSYMFDSTKVRSCMYVFIVKCSLILISGLLTRVKYSFVHFCFRQSDCGNNSIKITYCHNSQ